MNRCLVIAIGNLPRLYAVGAGCIILAGCTSVPVPQASVPTPQASSWPIEKTSIRLGEPSDSPSWAGVDAPPAVVRAASQILPGDPSTWRVSHIVKDEFVDNNEVVVLSTLRASQDFVCLIRSIDWLRLNEPDGLPFISDILGKYIHTSSDLTDEAKLETYVGEVAWLYGGAWGYHVLCKRFAQREFSKEWLGEVKDPKVVLAWCNDFGATVNGQDVEIRAYLILLGGRVEYWVMKGRLEQRLNLTQIIVKRIGGPGTLAYRWIP
jgi:hypothetical protein